MQRRAKAEFLLAILVIALSLGVQRASAGTPMCISNHVPSRNFASLESEATRAADRHVLDWKSLWLCVTPVGRVASITARPEAQPDGSELRLVAECKGDSNDWRCTLESARHALFSLPISGREQRFDLAVPAAFTPEDARQLTARAFEVAAHLTWKEHCFARGNAPAPAWRSNAERDLHAAFGPQPDTIRGSIDERADGTAISIDSTVLTFKRPLPADGRELLCWNEVIALT